MLDVVGRIHRIHHATVDHPHICNARDEIGMNLGVDIQSDFPPPVLRNAGGNFSRA